MKVRIPALFMAAGLALFFAVDAKADFYVVVGDDSIPVFNKGQVGATISVYAFHDEDWVTRTLAGYDLKFDFDTPGKGWNESYFSNLQADFSTAPLNTWPGFQVAEPDMDNYDFLASATGPATEIPTTFATRMKLFDFSFDVSPTAQSGIYDVVFRPDGTNTNPPFGPQNLNNLDGFAVATITRSPIGGQFQIVPEPSSLLCLMTAAGLGLLRRRRRD